MIQPLCVVVNTTVGSFHGVRAATRARQAQWESSWSTRPLASRPVLPGIRRPGKYLVLGDKSGKVPGADISSPHPLTPLRRTRRHREQPARGFRDRNGRRCPYIHRYSEAHRILEMHDLDIPVLTDPHRAAYKAYGLGRGSVRRVWGRRATRRYWNILRDSSLKNL